MPIIAAFKNGETKVYTKTAHQFDRGQKLIVTGIALPNSFEIHFSNDPENGIATSCKGNPEGVMIPDAYFVSGDYIYAWLYAKEKEEGSHSGYVMGDDETLQVVEGSGGDTEEGYTLYTIIIPIARRPVQNNVNLGGSSGGGGSDPEMIGYIVDENEVLIPVIK